MSLAGASDRHTRAHTHTDFVIVYIIWGSRQRKDGCLLSEVMMRGRAWVTCVSRCLLLLITAPSVSAKELRPCDEVSALFWSAFIRIKRLTIASQNKNLKNHPNLL